METAVNMVPVVPPARQGNRHGQGPLGSGAGVRSVAAWLKVAAWTTAGLLLPLLLVHA